MCVIKSRVCHCCQRASKSLHGQLTPLSSPTLIRGRERVTFLGNVMRLNRYFCGLTWEIGLVQVAGGRGGEGNAL